MDGSVKHLFQLTGFMIYRSFVIFFAVDGINEPGVLANNGAFVAL